MKLNELKVDVHDRVCQALRVSISGKDYRALAGKMGYTTKDVNNFNLEKDPARALLYDWDTEDGNNVGKLIQMLSKLGRDDVIEIIQKD